MNRGKVLIASLSIILIENRKSNQIRNDVIIPQNSFKIVEDKQFHMF